jgi:Tol biopolymer transport system component
MKGLSLSRRRFACLVMLVAFGLLVARGSAETGVASAQGDKIAFVRNFGTAPPDVYVMNSDGSGRRLKKKR